MNDNGPARAVAAQLQPIYIDEIHRQANAPDKNEQDHRANRLGDYIMILFLIGRASDERMKEFWEHAPESVREHAMSSPGRELTLPPDRLEARFRTRGLSYWEMRLAAAASDPERHRREVGVIGQWCRRDNVDAAWLLDQLSKMLDAGFAPSNGYFVVEWLSKIAPKFPDVVVAVLLRLLANPHTDHWTYSTRRDAIRAILEAGLGQGSQETVTRVHEVVSLLSTLEKRGTSTSSHERQLVHNSACILAARPLTAALLPRSEQVGRINPFKRVRFEPTSGGVARTACLTRGQTSVPKWRSP